MVQNNWSNRRIVLAILSFIALFSCIAGLCSSLVNPVEVSIFHLFGLGLTLILIVTLVLAIIWAFLRNWAWCVVLVVAIGINYGFIGNMWRISFHKSERPQDLRVLTYNVHSFYGAKLERAYGVARYISQEQPDIVCFQEFAEGNDDGIYNLFRQYPYRKQMGEFAIMSKFPMSNFELQLLGEDKFGYMSADLSYYGETIRVICAHLQTTGVNTSVSQIKHHGSAAFSWIGERFTYLIQYRAQQLATLKNATDTASFPVLLCGDLNDTPASYGYRQLKTHLNDDFTSCGSGYASTFVGIKGLMRIDYIFFDDNFKGLRRKAPSMSESDHKPITLDLQTELGVL